jgi:hypothetical protein
VWLRRLVHHLLQPSGGELRDDKRQDGEPDQCGDELLVRLVSPHLDTQFAGLGGRLGIAADDRGSERFEGSYRDGVETIDERVAVRPDSAAAIRRITSIVRFDGLS